MGEATTISWTHHTWNPWWGCTKISPACTHCYAATFAERPIHKREDGTKGALRIWGDDAPRRTWFGPDHWTDPIKWNRAAEKEGERRRVFVASMADIFEDRPELVPLRYRALSIMRVTPWLDYLLLTKRSGLIRSQLVGALEYGRALERAAVTIDVIDEHTQTNTWIDHWLYGMPPDNVWVGATAENPSWLDVRAAELASVPALVRFLSCEPLLAGIPNLSAWVGRGALFIDRKRDAGPIDWVVVGLESGNGRRDPGIRVLLDVVDVCTRERVPVHVKQDCAFKSGEQGRIPDDVWQRKEFPRPVSKERYL